MLIYRGISLLVTLLWALYTGTHGLCSLNTTSVLRGVEGEIKSPGFDDGSYPPNQDCVWKVELDYPFSKANITFVNFQLDAPDNCDSTVCDDFVKITDGSIGIFDYFASESTASHVTPNNSFQIQFTTDESGSAKGFHLRYTSICEFSIKVDDPLHLPSPPRGIPGPCRFHVYVTKANTGIHIKVPASTHHTNSSTTDCAWKVQLMDSEVQECLQDSDFGTENDSLTLIFTPHEELLLEQKFLNITSIAIDHPCSHDNPCNNHGNCVELSGSFPIEKRCKCVDGFLGERCEIEDPCSEQPCENNGTCTADMANPNNYTCTCANAFSGRNCTVFDACFEWECQGLDTCFTDNMSCKCIKGFVGKECDIKDRCSSRPCKNNGLCTNLLTIFSCSCTEGHQGRTCDIPDDISHCRGDVYHYGDAEIAWEPTEIGHTDTQPCPPGVTGNATRRCQAGVTSPVASWQQPDLSGCVSQRFLDLHSLAESISNTEQLDTEAFLNLTSTLTEATRVVHDNRGQLYAGDLTMATTIVESLSTLVRKADGSGSVLSEITQGYGKVVSNIVHPATAAVWRFTKPGYTEDQVTSLLKSVETLSSHVADVTSRQIPRQRRSKELSDTNGETIFTNAANLYLEISVLPRDGALNRTTFEGRNIISQITLPLAVFHRALQNTDDRFISLYAATFPSISPLLLETNRHFVNRSNVTNQGVVNSDIVSSRILNVPEWSFEDLEEPVEIIFNLKNTTLSSSLESNCVFLNLSATSFDDRWPTRGCRKSVARSNSSHVVCYCRHLTNFAVLMDVYDVEGDIDGVNLQVLTYLSYAGGGLSIVCCLISIFVYEFFRLRNERVRVHQQLALTIILVQGFFLFGIDRTENMYVCMSMAICLHYFLTAMFCWMLVEGVHLYLVLVKVFKSRSHLAKYIMIGWGVPVVVVGISAGIFHSEYGTDEVCWLSRKVLLVAVVPTVGLVILINTVILLVVMRTMLKSMATGSKATREERSTVRAGLKAAAILLPLLGLTWTLGFLSIDSKETLIFTYLFTLFNSLQGVFFFVFHCLLSVDVQNAYDRRSRRQSQKRLTESSFYKPRDRKTSEMDSSPYSTYFSKSSLHTMMTDMSNGSLSSFDRRRSNKSNVTGRPQSVTFDDDVFLPGEFSRQSSLHERHGDYNETVLSSSKSVMSEPIGHVLNNSTRKRRNSDDDDGGYYLYYGKGRIGHVDKTLTEKNDLYAEVKK